MKRWLTLACAIGLGACASRGTTPPEAPAAAEAVVRVRDDASAYLHDAEEAFRSSRNEDPTTAQATLRSFAARSAPGGLAATDAAYIANEVDRELALRALDAGDASAAVVDIERALARTEQHAVTRDATTAALLLVAEEVYLRAGRSDSARWAHTEARAILEPATPDAP